MITPISIIIFLIIISVVILAHELGHFITARASGVRVEEFGLGFPPRIFSIKRGETVYSLNAIPLGGFTKMAGEEDPKVPRSLANKNAGIRLLVLSAGSIMNLLLPLLLFSIAFMVPHDLVIEPAVIKTVVPNSPAALAGIEAGDTIIGVDTKAINNRSEVQRYVQTNLGKEISLFIRHSDSTGTEIRWIKLIPRWRHPQDEGPIGIEFDPEIAQMNRTVISESFSLWKAVPMAVSASVETLILFKNEIVSMIIGSIPLAVSGPVGIAQVAGEVAKTGISPLLEFTAFISINLGVVNLFPLPALDGGRVAFVLLEVVRRGKRVSPKTEGVIHLIGFALLIGLIVLVTYQDIARIIAGGSLVP